MSTDLTVSPVLKATEETQSVVYSASPRIVYSTNAVVVYSTNAPVVYSTNPPIVYSTNPVVVYSTNQLMVLASGQTLPPGSFGLPIYSESGPSLYSPGPLPFTGSGPTVYAPGPRPYSDSGPTIYAPGPLPYSGSGPTLYAPGPPVPFSSPDAPSALDVYWPPYHTEREYFGSQFSAASEAIKLEVKNSTQGGVSSPEKVSSPSGTQQAASPIQFHAVEGLTGIMAHLSEKLEVPLRLATYTDTKFGGLRIAEYRISPGTSVDLNGVSGALKTLEKVDKVTKLYSIYRNTKSEFESRGITGSSLVDAWVASPQSVIFAFKDPDAGIKALTEGFTSASAVSIRFVSFGLIEVHGPEIEQFVNKVATQAK